MTEIGGTEPFEIVRVRIALTLDDDTTEEDIFETKVPAGSVDFDTIALQASNTIKSGMWEKVAAENGVYEFKYRAIKKLVIEPLRVAGVTL